MALEVEFFGLTGMVGGTSNDLLWLKHAPTTGINGEYDVAVDPTDGPAQRMGIDFGITFSNTSGLTAAVTLNMANSDIKDVLNNYQHGVTGILTLRVMYNYQ